MVKKWALSLFFLFVVVQTGQAIVTVNEIKPYIVEGQGILPNTGYTYHGDVVGKYAAEEGYIVILGLDIASNRGQRLISIALDAALTTMPKFEVDSSVIIDRSGKILGEVGGVGTITISPDGAPIPPDNIGGNAGDDFFVAIRTTDLCEDDARAYFSVPRSGVVVSPAEAGDVTNAGITTASIYCELVIADILPEEYDNIHSDGVPSYSSYYQWQPGEMIRPRYDHSPQDYQRAPMPFPLVHQVPQVIPWETRTAVLAIGCAQRNAVVTRGAIQDPPDPPEYLTGITITVTDTGKADFDPNYYFRNEATGKPGITLWRDANQDGRWDPTLDTPVSLSYEADGVFTKKPGLREWTLHAWVNAGYGDRIDWRYDGLYDYFVVIEVRSDSGYPTFNTMGSDYKIWIEPGNVEFWPLSHPVRYAGIGQEKTKVIYNNVFLEDLLQDRVDPNTVDVVDMNSNIIPVLGIDLAGGPVDLFPNLRIENIRLEVLDLGNFNPGTALDALTDDGYSGVSLWRDNKTSGYIGSFDSADTLVPCHFTGWTFDGIVDVPGWGPVPLYHTFITIQSWSSDTGLVPPDDDLYHNSQYRGDDFFICVRTTEDLPYGAKFAFRIPSAGLWLTAPKVAQNSNEKLTGEATGNIATTITSLVPPGNTGISPSSNPVSVFKIDLTDNGSGRFPQLQGLTVEFYDRGGFTLTDLASFNPVSPVFNGTTGWFDVTNFNPNNLKQCGVVVYRDSALTQPVLVSRYRQHTQFTVPQPGGDAPLGYQFEFQTPVSIPTTLYVAIRTSATFTPGDSFTAGIVGWGRTEAHYDVWGARAIPIIDSGSIQSNVYARIQGVTFNSGLVGTLTGTSQSFYQYVLVDWDNATGVPQSQFLYYEITRDGQVVQVISDFNTTEWLDYLGSEDGQTHTYTVRMYYKQGGQTLSMITGEITGRAYGFPEGMWPEILAVVPGYTNVWVQWEDETPHTDPDDPYQADSFRLKRTNLEDNTTFEILIYRHEALSDILYEYTDTGLVPGTAYRYDIFVRREVATGTVESGPSTRVTTTYNPEGDVTDGGGGCFIATVSFGSPLARQVEILRAFRDRYLLIRPLGRKLVAWYYQKGRAAAGFIDRHPWLKPPVRILLYPVIGFAWLLVVGGFWGLTFLLSLSFLWIVSRDTAGAAEWTPQVK